MFCLVRTSRDGRPQQGITFLLLDMALPGIEVRPILTLSGDHDFNQVFFDNVRVPQSGRLGEEDQGGASPNICSSSNARRLTLRG